jgi:hypothetical protein
LDPVPPASAQAHLTYIENLLETRCDVGVITPAVRTDTRELCICVGVVAVDAIPLGQCNVPDRVRVDGRVLPVVTYATCTRIWPPSTTGTSPPAKARVKDLVVVDAVPSG